jgi:hypothetical protein
MYLRPKPCFVVDLQTLAVSVPRTGVYVFPCRTASVINVAETE